MSDLEITPSGSDHRSFFLVILLPSSQSRASLCPFIFNDVSGVSEVVIAWSFHFGIPSHSERLSSIMMLSD